MQKDTEKSLQENRQTLPQDKVIDSLRKPAVGFMLLGLAIGWLFFSPTENKEVLYVTFTNTSDVAISSLQLDFGSANTQTSLLSLSLPANSSRTLALNHPAGAGFNLIATYANGKVQDFCANRGVKGQQQSVKLRLD